MIQPPSNSLTTCDISNTESDSDNDDSLMKQAVEVCSNEEISAGLQMLEAKSQIRKNKKGMLSIAH